MGILNENIGFDPMTARVINIHMTNIGVNQEVLPLKPTPTVLITVRDDKYLIYIANFRDLCPHSGANFGATSMKPKTHN